MPIPNGVWGLPHSNKVGTLAAMLHKKAVRRRRTPLHLFGGVFCGEERSDVGKRYARVAAGWSVPHGVMFGSVRMMEGLRCSRMVEVWCDSCRNLQNAW